MGVLVLENMKSIFIAFSLFLLHHCHAINSENDSKSKDLPAIETDKTGEVHSLDDIQTIDEIITSEAVGCGNYALHSGESVDFQTPNFPDKYPKDYKCTWRFTCPSENSAMEVKCERFELEANRICFTDYLEIFNHFKSLGKYCGKNSPSGLISNSNFMKAIFHSNWDRITRTGFKCNVKCMDKQSRHINLDENKNDPAYVPPLVPCGSYVMDPDDSVIIRSKNFPKSYPKNQKCTWRFTCSSSNADMMLHCDSFALQNTRSCNDDYLQIFNGFHSLGKHCGKKGPEYLHSNSNYMKINFRSNGDRITRHGFHCILSCKEKMDKKSLPVLKKIPEFSALNEEKSLRDTSVQISSDIAKDPPNNGQEFVDAVLEDLAVKSQQILADKNNLVLPILDSNDTLTTIINKLAAYPKLEEVVSYIEENAVGPGRNWIGQLASKVHISQVAGVAVECGSHDINPGDKIYFQSPNYPYKYPRNYKCNWSFNCAAENAIMELNCDDHFELQKNPLCHTDYLETFGKSGSIRKNCGKDAPKELISKSNFMSVVFRANWDKIRRSGFSCNVMCTNIAKPAKPVEHPVPTRAADSLTTSDSPNENPSTPPSPPLPCGKHDIEPGKPVYFESVDYPDKYNNNESCRWRFICSAMNSMMEVDCPDFHIESDPLCVNDYLKVKDPYGNLGLYCGDDGPANLVTYSNDIKVYFTTDHEKKKKTGFRCSVKCSEIAISSTSPLAAGVLP